MTIKFNYNEEYAFFIFVSFFSGILFLISGVSWFSAFLTGLFIYIFLRFTYFLWRFVSRIFHVEGKPDE